MRYTLQGLCIHLDIESLVELTTQTIGDKVKVMIVEEIQRAFNIKNNFTLVDEAEIQKTIVRRRFLRILDGFLQ